MRLRAANQRISESANRRIGKWPEQRATLSHNHAIRNTHHASRFALFRDRAFTFYYPENLEALEAAGAELVFVDAFRDAALPDVDALYIGGGFPEIFMDELSANAALRASVRAAAEAGLPIYAECGGLMYLARRIIWGERSGGDGRGAALRRGNDRPAAGARLCRGGRGRAEPVLSGGHSAARARVP